MGFGSLLSCVVCVFSCKFIVFWDAWVQRVNAGSRKTLGQEQCSVQPWLTALFIFIGEAARARPAPDFSHSIQKVMFTDSCRELLTRGLNREGREGPFLRPTQPLGFSAEGQAQIHHNRLVETKPKQLSGSQKPERWKSLVINVVASRSPGATRHASCLGTVVGLTVVWVT